MFFWVDGQDAPLKAPTGVGAEGGCSILVNLKAEFRRRNPQIAHVKIVDVRPAMFEKPKYLVLGWGIRADRHFKGSFEDELFGLFIVDESLSAVEKVIDFIPTPRWHDTEMRIKKLDASVAVLEAKAETYGYGLLRRTYNLTRRDGTFPLISDRPSRRRRKS
jgi:hypothetical protein